MGIITVIIYLWRFARSFVSKKELDEQMNKKASKKMVESELKLVDERIKNVEKLSIIQDRYLKETLEEHYAILENVQNDIKELLQRKS
jgi:biopolymer transport protein ExbB/TolQ